MYVCVYIYIYIYVLMIIIMIMKMIRMCVCVCVWGTWVTSRHDGVSRDTGRFARDILLLFSLAQS